MPEPPHSLQDKVLHDRLKQIVYQHRIKVVVETGVDKGLSTIKFAKMVETVFAIDNVVNALLEANRNLAAQQISNVVLCSGSSPEVLWALRPLLPRETLYFLDAHWQEYWPLLDEIEAIAPGTGVIVVHDMRVPGHPELGFDSYGGKCLDYEYVAPALVRWSQGHRVEYNSRTEGTEFPRGCGIFFPEKL